MNSKEKGKFSKIKRKNLFLNFEECKTNLNKDNNDIRINKINFEFNKTYNNYDWNLKLKQSNLKNITSDDIDNQYYITDKSDNNNISIEANYQNIKTKEKSTNKNINNNNSENKQFLNNDNKTEKEDEIIPNLSAIKKENSPNKYDTLKKANLQENNNENKENIDTNSTRRKPLIHEPNILNSTKIQELKQNMNQRNNKTQEKSENIKNDDTKRQSSLNKRPFKNDNPFINFNTNNNNSIKNKLYHYLTSFEDGKNNSNFNNSYNNMRLNILRRKIRDKNKADSERTHRLTYVGLKRYQNISLSNLSQMQKGINTYYMINETINRSNNLKKEINNIINIDYINDLNQKPKIYDILKKNKGMEDIISTMVKKSDNNKNKKHYNKILNQLNKTIEKLPKNEANFEIEKIDINKTFRKYSNSRINEISPIEKNRKIKNIFLDQINYIRTNNYNDKNKKLIFESKMNNMNNTINQLLKITPEFNMEKRITFPANNFRKTNSICKNFNIRKKGKVY